MQINVLLVVMEFLHERSGSPEDAPLLIAMKPMGPVRLANTCTLAVFHTGRGGREAMAAAYCIRRLYADPSLTLLLLPQRDTREQE